MEVKSIEKKVAIYTLGCKVNQVETESIKEGFVQRGYQVVGMDEVADVYVINTCTVTHVSDRKSRAMLRRARRKNPQAVVVAAGCFAEISPEQIADMPEVNIVVGNREKEGIAALVEEYRAGEVTLVRVGGEKAFLPRLSQVQGRSRAFIKIQDGCESYCSYCIVPYTRGPIRSKAPGEVLEEIRHLIESGYREVVLTGIHTGMYGKDLPGWSLASLVEEILDKVEGEYRLRLSSIEPLEISDKMINLIETDRRICRHLHIPLQSGSDRILKLMNRRYTREFYFKLLEKLSRQVPAIALTSDVMVGFPTESPEDFLDTLQLVEELPFFDLHVFPYSDRPGTRACSFSPQVTAPVKEERSRALLSLARKKKSRFIEGFLQRELTVLVEEQLDNGLYDGLTDNYIRVVFSGNEELKGKLVTVVLTENKGASARGYIP